MISYYWLNFTFLIKNCFYLALFLLLQKSVSSQECASEHYTIKEGLPSNEVFDIYQDRKGFIWIGTDKGVSRFDGSEFEYLTTADGLADNVVLTINQDRKGKIWFLSYNGRLSFWENGKIFNGSNTPVLEGVHAGGYFHSFLEDSRDNLWFGTSKSGWLRIDSGFNSLDKTSLSKEKVGGGTYYFFEKRRDSVYLICRETIYQYSEKEFIPYAKLPEVQNKSRFYYSRDSETLYFTASNKLLAYHLSEKRFLWKKQIIDAKQVNSLEVLSDGLIYVATDNGFHIFSQNGQQLKSYLKGKIVSDVLIDREQNLWASTLSNGVFLIRNRNIFIYNTEPLFSMETRGDTVYFGGTGPKLHYALNGNIGLSKYRAEGLRSISTQDRLMLLRKGPKNKLWIGTSKGLYRLDGNNIELIYHSSVFDLIFLNQFVYVASMYGLIELDSLATRSIRSIYLSIDKQERNKIKSSTIISKYVKEKLKVTNFSQVDSSLFLLGTKDSIYEFSNARLIPLAGISDGEIVQNGGNNVGEFWFLDRWKGLYYFDKETVRLSKISLDSTKSGVEYNSFFLDRDDIVWVASSTGLFKVEKGEKQFKVSHIGASEGFINKELNAVKIVNDTIWLATSEGITYFPKMTFNDTVAPIFYIDSILFNGSNIQDASLVKSISTTNKLSVFLTSISFKDKEDLQFHYKLEGNSIDSGFFSTSTFSFTDLPPCDYRLTLFAMDPSGNRSSVRDFSFSVIIPWWYNKVLWGAILIVVVAGFIILIRNRRHYQNLVERNSETKPSILVKSVLDGSKAQLYLDDLLYIKGAKDYLELFSEEKKIMVRITMKAFLENLEEAPEFIRVHKSYIVNSQKVSSYKSDSLQIGDEIIPIGRSFQNQVRAFFGSLASD